MSSVMGDPSSFEHLRHRAAPEDERYRALRDFRARAAQREYDRYAELER
ncbi:MAG: hypothetical protein M3Q08_15530 [Pseudomonadota bacterium]|nr:hypothetical protein [Pseudomonadota bacterium]